MVFERDVEEVPGFFARAVVDLLLLPVDLALRLDAGCSIEQEGEPRSGTLPRCSTPVRYMQARARRHPHRANAASSTGDCRRQHPGYH